MKVLFLLFFASSTFLYSISYKKILSNVKQVTTIEFEPSGKYMYVLEKTGKIIRYNPKSKQKSLFLDISHIVSTASEQGLLGIAFHPNYSKNGLFYLNYTIQEKSRFTIIAVYQRRKGKNTYRGILFKVKQPYANHNAGQLVFDKKGFLYIGFGDGGSGNDPFRHGQNTKTYLGSMIRIKPSTIQPSKYGIPSDNPFVKSKGFLPEIWAYGLRNPWRYSFDQKTGELYLADVGQNKYEEINLIQKAGNYGWNIYEGFHCFKKNRLCKSKQKFQKPIYEYPHSRGSSITGGYVYRGKTLPKLNGFYIYGDFVSGRIWAFDKKSKTNKQLFQTDFGISTFGQDKQGEIYFADFFQGNIYKLQGLSP